MKMFKMTEEEAAKGAEEETREQPIDESVRKRVIEEYLRERRAAQAAFVRGGAIPKTPQNKPKTIAEAAEFAREIMDKKGE